MDVDDAHTMDHTLPRRMANDSSSDSDAATGRRPPMRNATRDRARAEMTALRVEAAALEHERNILQLKRKRHDVTSPLLGTADQWARVAETERVTRTRAEAEHEWLVAMLQHQVGLSAVLERVLSKRARQDRDNTPDRLNPLPQRPRRHCDASIGMLHAQFSRDIQRIYKAGIKRIFDQSDWSAARAELGLSVVREEKVDETTHERMVEIRETRHVPFEYQHVADAVWRCVVQPFAQEGRVLESYSSPADQITITYRAAPPSNVARGDLLTAVMVMHKFEEPERTVHVWRVMSSATEQPTRETQRAFSDESGWIIIEPVPPGIERMEPDTAVVRFVGQLVPLWPDESGGVGDDSASGPLRPDDFHDLVVEGSCEDIVALGDAVGNLLLDESLGLASDLHHV